MTKEEKHKACELREAIIELGKTYSKDSLNYMSKNSSFDGKRAARRIYYSHIENETLRRVFMEKATKLINKG